MSAALRSYRTAVGEWLKTEIEEIVKITQGVVENAFNGRDMQWFVNNKWEVVELIAEADSIEKCALLLTDKFLTVANVKLRNLNEAKYHFAWKIQPEIDWSGTYAPMAKGYCRFYFCAAENGATDEVAT